MAAELSGQTFVHQGQETVLISIDMPNVVIQAKGESRCRVIPLSVVASSLPVFDVDSLPPIEGEHEVPRFSLDDLFAKINGFQESAQMDDLPMLSKASVLAQISMAQSLVRICELLANANC
jgi:hypothetical protein